MQYLLYNRINSKNFPKSYQWPSSEIIKNWWEFQWTSLFVAQYTLFGIIWDNDFDKIAPEFSPVQYTPQWAVDLLNEVHPWDYFVLEADWFTIKDTRPIE